MSIIVDCPSCNRKLRVPEDLLGTRVKCPTCGGTFDAVVSPEDVPSPSDAELASERPEELPEEKVRETPHSERPSPRDPRDEDEQEEDDRPWERPYEIVGLRRDSEPHRAGLVLALGIISIV